MNSLNPCFVGMWSFSGDFEYCEWEGDACLNPCFVGMWSFRPIEYYIGKCSTVLILVLLGCGLLGEQKMYIVVC